MLLHTYYIQERDECSESVDINDKQLPQKKSQGL